MNFELPVETYIRLCGVSNYIRDDISDAERKLLRCVRLEHKGGKTFALASNRKIAAIYFLGETTEADGAIHLNVDALLLKQCETEKAFNSKLQIVAVPELGVVSIKTTLGFQSTAGFFASGAPFEGEKGWHKWAADEQPKATKGAMHWNMIDMLALNASSPSGRINFPEFIDASKPVVVRDAMHADWVGLFMANLVDDKDKAYTVDPATLPAWWHK